MSIKYSTVSGCNAVGRYVRKLAAISHHGAKCFVCGERFDVSKQDEARWQFAHIDPVNSPNDKSDRWSGFWRDAKLFTDDWYSFMGRVKLTCSQRCNKLAEGHDDYYNPVRAQEDPHVDFSTFPTTQLTMDL